MHSINLNSLRMFDAAAQHLNFGNAAEELNLTQGAVAQQVRKLEGDLGLKLFERHARGLSLTGPGRSYAASVRKGLNIIDEATQKLVPAPAKLTLSVPPSLATKWLVPRLKDFMQAHPDIEVNTLASETLSNFTSDGVTLAIRIGKRPKQASLDTIELSPLNMVAVSSSGLAEKIGSPITLADLTRHPLIYDEHNYWMKLISDAGLDAPRAAMSFNQTALAIDAAAAGEGVALVPRLIAQGGLANGTLVEVWKNHETTQDAYHLVWPKAAAPKAPRDAMIDWLLEQVED